MADKKYYLIGEVIELTGATREKLRNYEKNGFIAPITAGNNKYRLYSSDDIQKIMKISVLDELGLDTKTAKTVSIGRNTIRDTLEKEDFELQNIVSKRADELSSLIKLLRQKWLLAKMLEYSIFPVFNSKTNDKDELFANGIENTVAFCNEISLSLLFQKELSSTIIDTLKEFYEKPAVVILGRERMQEVISVSKNVTDFLERVYNSIELIEASFDENDKLKDVEYKKIFKYIYISFVNADHANFINRYFNSLNDGSMDVNYEFTKAKMTSMIVIDKLCDFIFSRNNLIPSNCIPVFLDIAYQKTIQKVNSIDEDTKKELVQILSEFMGGDTNDLAFYYKKVIDYLSQKAESTEIRKNEAGEINKTSLYKFFEGLK